MIWKKNIENLTKDGLIIKATTVKKFFTLKEANVKPPKSSLDAMNIIKLTGGILVKDYAVYKKMNQRVKNCYSASYEEQNKSFIATGSYKYTTC